MSGRAPVAAVVVTLDSEAWIGPCLDSLARLERPPEETVIVDNGSCDHTLERVRETAPGAVVVANGLNLGFCRANNQGIARTRSPYVLALNPDAVLDPRYVEVLLAAFEDRSVGIAVGKLWRPDGVTLDSAGQDLARSRQPRDRGYGERDRGAYDGDEDVFSACAAAALYRRRTLEAISDPGGEIFDEAFFAYYEDLDVAWRARKLGYRTVYRPAATGRHARGAAAGPTGRRRGTALTLLGPDLRFHAVKNRWLTIVRNDSVPACLRNLPWIAARDAAVLALLVATSPGVLVRLGRSADLLVRALRRRRLDAERPRHKVPGGGVP